MEARLPRLFSRDWLWGLFLVAATVLAYHTVWHAGFIWDDDLHLTRNPSIVGGLGFKSIWLTSAATYYPLTLTSFWIQHALWGLNPAPYHLVNVFLHAACGLLMWQVLVRLHVRGAWLGAALWTLHPVQVESVAWITELKNTQSCFFYLLSILSFLRWRELRDADRKSGGWHYTVALLCAVLAILSKSSTVMLPVVLGLCLWWMDGRCRWRNIIALSPFLLISALASGWTIWEQKFHSGALGVEWAQTWPERFIIAGLNIWFYLGKLAWPHPLIFQYAKWRIDAAQPLTYLSIFAAVIGMFALWRGRNGRMRPLFFACAYFVVSLFPVLDFFNVYYFRYSFVGDHFQYLASMGPLALAAAGIITLVGFLERKQPVLKPIVCGALLLLLGVLTWRQCATYADAETLWRTTIAQNSSSWFGHNNLGAVLLQGGRIDEALAVLQKAVEINPRVPETHTGVAAALIQVERVEEAVDHLKKALEIDPNNAEAYGNLGGAMLKSGRVDEAIAHLQKAVELDRDYLEAYSNLGLALLQTGRVEESLAQLQKALEIAPDYGPAQFNIATTLLKLGRADESLAHLQKALTIDPNDAEAQNNMAWILATWPEARIRNGARAVELAERANELARGRNPVIGTTLAAAYAEIGRFADAIKTAEGALQLANSSGNRILAEEIRGQIALYQSGQPFRDKRQ
jgi:tetratricopeptide (TPR) repeat protein